MRAEELKPIPQPRPKINRFLRTGSSVHSLGDAHPLATNQHVLRLRTLSHSIRRKWTSSCAPSSGPSWSGSSCSKRCRAMMAFLRTSGCSWSSSFRTAARTAVSRSTLISLQIAVRAVHTAQYEEEGGGVREGFQGRPLQSAISPGKGPFR